MRPTKALISRLYILAILVLGVSLPAQAQTSSGFSDYFILGHEEHVWNMMQRVRAGEGAAAFPAPSRMNSVASATSTSDGQILIFDHWEDGFEGKASVSTLTRSGTLATVTTAANHNYVNGAVVTIDGATSDPTLWNGTFSVTVTSATQFTYVMTGTPAVSPATGIIGASASPFDVAAHQATTLVLGDANIANGRACDWTSDPRVTCGGANPDTLFIGTAMTFASDQGMAGACAAPVASPAVTQLTCSVPVPRAVPTLANPTIRFDGGDRAR